MSDRICIASNEKIQVTLSADDLLSCCKSCGFGCMGGEPLEAWQYWVDHGIVTGSNFTMNQGYKNYDDDKFYGRTAYGVKDEVAAIQKEVLTHGPVEVAFEVYEDFLHYAGGVYVHTGGKLGGGHAVKLIGWGIDQGTPYWLIANSWNTDWGEDGFFRIVRGVDECGIESGVVGGIPKLTNIQRRGYIENYAWEDDDL
ncbi:peptidyl-prolyl cis-trans isomerase cpr6 [Parelaphostrongylus tenuis]|uniref:Peptidyl-prolyl cis-trans isomerase cpr6 n=1 Tax=Parelaphostrongylus tenuis TaxID=148309 RepID=A0AAD5WLW7_PARTN|nr:peptidyl-prolyl cis-trans isomerase cpr6 [Parelaphostrongylus tenuis]